jgi:hypothetical protein
VLVMISMLAYFCFLEQLLVGKLGSGAIVIALPFACILGFLAAIAASNLVAKKLIWLYATCQFGLIISFAHLFYDLVRSSSFPLSFCFCLTLLPQGLLRLQE